MEIQKLQTFKGVINGVEIDDQARFNMLEYLLGEIIVIAGGEVFNDNFIKDLDYLIDDLYLNTENTYGDIEKKCSLKTSKKLNVSKTSLLTISILKTTFKKSTNASATGITSTRKVILWKSQSNVPTSKGLLTALPSTMKTSLTPP